MKKVFKMVDLDCANCAAKMERTIEKIDGVEKVTISKQVKHQKLFAKLQLRL